MQKQQKQQARPVVMDATGKGDFDASGRGSELGTLDDSAGAAATAKNMGSLRPGSGPVEDPRGESAAKQKGGAATISEESVNEELLKLFNGENLTEEFMNKAAVIFEAAVNDRVDALREQLVQESAKVLEEEVTKHVQELSTRLDEYVGYVVEEWMKENKLAVESGIRTEIAESFMGGLKTLFETHYIEVPEAKHDILEDLFAENQELESALSEQLQANVTMRNTILETQAKAVFLETVKDMTEVDAERLASLAESVEFNDVEEFANKLAIIKENYLKAAPVAVKEEDSITERTAAVLTEGNDIMSGYVNSVARQLKKY